MGHGKIQVLPIKSIKFGNMAKQQKIIVKGTNVSFFDNGKEDFISLTDIAKFKNPDNPADIVKNWLRSNNTI